MKIDFNRPKYVLPLLALPFFFLFFYVYHTSAAKHKKQDAARGSINGSVAGVSEDIRARTLSGKLEAYQNVYKHGPGYTAVSPITGEGSAGPGFDASGSDQQKTMPDAQLKNNYSGTEFRLPARENPSNQISAQEGAMADALTRIRRGAQKETPPQGKNPVPAEVKERDPMEIFRQQMAYIDSMGKASDPAYKARKQKEQAQEKAEELHSRDKILKVEKAASEADVFNTLMPLKKENFMMAVTDEEVTGYAGSRVRLRLLEDIRAGNTLIKKGTRLYALISGFSGQRVILSVSSIADGNEILPVKLEVYDLDGLCGLYVPGSRFRDFTKDLGTSTIQGVAVDGNTSSGSQFLMSSMDKVFQSASSAVAAAIRKDKARIKYSSFVYLIDGGALQNPAGGKQ
jgi:hypothetical protein